MRSPSATRTGPAILPAMLCLAVAASITSGGCPSSPIGDEAALGSFGGLGATDSGGGTPRAPGDDTGRPAPDGGGGVDGAPGSEAPVPDPAGNGGGVGVNPGDGIQSGTLTAGSFDDNLNLEVFRAFLSEALQQDAEASLPQVQLGQRAIIRVADADGAPVGNVRVTVSGTHPQTQQVTQFLDQPTGTDGRAVFFSGLDGASGISSFNLTVFPSEGDAVSSTVSLDQPDWAVALNAVEAAPPPQLDLLFVVDTTGSMGDELEYLKAEVQAIASAVEDKFPNVTQRFGFIVYRDEGDIYVTRRFDFSDDLDAFRNNLAQQRAEGGGDRPEAMDAALRQAGGMDWSQGSAARVLFLIADAPPHRENSQAALDAILDLRQAGVAVFPVGASDIGGDGEFVMRTAALVTLSEYLFLTDDSGVGNTHDQPHIPCYHVQRLDHLMTRIIESELSGRRIEPAAAQIIRTVGEPVNGVCAADEAAGAAP